MNESQKRQLIEQLVPSDGSKSKVVIVSAKHGMGKTTFIEETLKDYGWKIDVRDVSMYDSEDWESLYDLVSIRRMGIAIHIPTIDNVRESRLIKLVKSNHNNAIVLETSKVWGFKQLRAYCRDITLDVLDWRAMTQIMKERGTYSGKTPQNLYHAYGDGKFDRVESEFSLTAKFFKGEDIPVTTKFLPWLIDNAPNYINGYELYQFYEYAGQLAELGKVEMISGLSVKGVGNPERPYYYKKLGLIRSGKAEGES